LKRNISAEIVSNHTEVLLKVVIPIPEDDLFHHAGFKNASKMAEVHDIDEEFIIHPPGKLLPKKSVIYYPDKKCPLWVVFKYELEKDPTEEPIQVEVN